MIQKEYIYKVYRDDTYLGVLQNVMSVFTFSQEINTVGAKLEVLVGLSFDVTGNQVEAILDETGDPILDEDGEELIEEKSEDVFGNASSRILLRNGNLVEVYEVSSYHPNGKKMFSGIINRLEGNFSGESLEESVKAVVHSRGAELDNYLIQDGA